MGLAQQTLDSLEVRAPLEGVVLYQRQGFNDIDVGSEVWPGQPLVDLANLRQFQGRFNVVESDMSGIERGKKAQVVLNAFPGQMFTGTIKQVGAAAQQLSYQDPRKYFVCEVVLDVPLEVMQHLKPGMRLTGEILVGVRKDALVVPKSAVIKKDAAFLVYVRSGQEYRERPVKIVDGDYGFYVLDGVREGESVCLQHPFEKQKLHLPDFSAPAASTQGRRFSIRIMG
jgi:multidrug efflux pump subunit AcrA (membrane-fusion protein)